MSAERQIAAMKAMMGVRSDSGLASALRMEKSNVCNWRKRGFVSGEAMRRAELMAEHGQGNVFENRERLACDIALLHERLADTRMNLGRLAEELESLASRARAMAADARATA